MSNITSARPNPIQPIKTASCSSLALTNPFAKWGCSTYIFPNHPSQCKYAENAAGNMQGHSQTGKSTETHRRWKQNPTGKSLSNKNKQCPLQSRSQPEREIQTESQNTRKQVTPDFFQKQEKKKKVGGVWNSSCPLDLVNSYPPAQSQ